VLLSRREIPFDGISGLRDDSGRAAPAGDRRGGQVTDPRLESLLSSLDVTFDAAIAREEDEAAADLAFSLVQDRSLADTLARSGAASLHVGDATVALAEVGHDYVGAGSPLRLVVPSRLAVIVPERGGRAPATAARSMLEVLRLWAREGAWVEASTVQGRWWGRLSKACPDHIGIRGRFGEVLVAMDAIRVVTKRPGGAAGAL
jgi:hypothetical protein